MRSSGGTRGGLELWDGPGGGGGGRVVPAHTRAPRRTWTLYLPLSKQRAHWRCGQLITVRRSVTTDSGRAGGSSRMLLTWPQDTIRT